jgi:hypothetical protein
MKRCIAFENTHIQNSFFAIVQTSLVFMSINKCKYKNLQL